MRQATVFVRYSGIMRLARYERSRHSSLPKNEKNMAPTDACPFLAGIEETTGKLPPAVSRF
jgi:hypothetical protein